MSHLVVRELREDCTEHFLSRLINADVNGSYNILRKAIPNAFSDGIESCVVRALRGLIRSK